MKSMFGFLLLIAAALLLLTVITGMGGIFGAIAQTWTTDQTAEIATGLSQVLWLGGIVVVMTLGYGLFVNMSKGSKGWSAGRGQAQDSNQYYVVDNAPQQPIGMIGMKSQENADWYDFKREEEYSD